MRHGSRENGSKPIHIICKSGTLLHYFLKHLLDEINVSYRTCVFGLSVTNLLIKTVSKCESL